MKLLQKNMIILTLVFVIIYFFNSLIDYGFSLYFNDENSSFITRDWSSLIGIYLFLIILVFTFLFILIRRKSENIVLIKQSQYNTILLMSIFFIILNKLAFYFILIDFSILIVFLMLFYCFNVLLREDKVEYKTQISDFTLKDFFSVFSFSVVLASVSSLIIKEILYYKYPPISSINPLISNETHVIIEIIKNLLLIILIFYVKRIYKNEKIDSGEWVKFLSLIVSFYLLNINFTTDIGVYLESTSFKNIFTILIPLSVLIFMPKLKFTEKFDLPLNIVDISFFFFLTLFVFNQFFKLISMGYNNEFIIKIVISLILFLVWKSKKISRD